MSKIDLNALVNGMRGKIGNAVLRRLGSRTLISSKPKARTSEPSVKEKAHRDLFKRAAAYAKAKMADPAAKAAYQQVASRKESNAFAIALRDFLKPPTVDAVRTDAYAGKINDGIFVKATDDFKVVAVKVTITLPTGALLESGAAVLDASTLEWKYAVTKANTTLVGTKVKAVASDQPGNETALEKVM
jgi:hypothetical protein